MIKSVGYVLVEDDCRIEPDLFVAPIVEVIPEPVFIKTTDPDSLTNQQILWISVGSALTLSIIAGAGVLGWYCKKRTDVKVSALRHETV
jgi:hypothetical protein